MKPAVKPKKHFGQHFLNDETIAMHIADALPANQTHVLEIGPGTGVLTKYLLHHPLHVIEIDDDSVKHLQQHYPSLSGKILHTDFLQLPVAQFFKGPIAIIGNFPYNISTQILFKVLDHKEQIPVVVGMFQKEVALRIAAKPGNKDYGITSVLLQAFYHTEYLFTVDAQVFIPPPKVQSGVVRLIRNDVKILPCDELIFKQVVKAAFNQRRKTLRNALKQFNKNKLPFLEKRAEQLSVDDFIILTQAIAMS